MANKTITIELDEDLLNGIHTLMNVDDSFNGIEDVVLRVIDFGLAAMSGQINDILQEIIDNSKKSNN